MHDHLPINDPEPPNPTVQSVQFLTLRTETQGRNGLINWNSALMFDDGRLHVHLSPDPLESSASFLSADLDPDPPPASLTGPGRLIGRYLLNFEERSGRTLQTVFEVRIIPQPVTPTRRPATALDAPEAWLTGPLRRDRPGLHLSNFIHDVYAPEPFGPYHERRSLSRAFQRGDA